MEFTGTLTVPPETLLALSEHLRRSASKISVEQAAIIAIEEWLSASRRTVPQLSPDQLRGYQWKDVFLPSGTDLRMNYAGHTRYARVEGDRLMYQGRQVSPRLFTQLVATGVRNAWRDLWVRLAGSRQWKRALDIRKEQQNAARKSLQSPVETMNAAAACMSEALKTALVLVEQSNAQSVRKFERRVERHRRESDVMADHCSFD